MKQFSLIVGLLLLSLLQSHAGSRGLALGFVDATQGERSKEDKRLFELFVKDAKEVLLSEDYYKGFNWEKGGDKGVKTIPSSSIKGMFQKMLILEDKKQEMFQNLTGKHNTVDGIVVYEYDKVGKQVRLKLFNHSGEELLLIRLKLAQDGPMKDSLYRHVRRGAVIALGATISFSP